MQIAREPSLRFCVLVIDEAIGRFDEIDEREVNPMLLIAQAIQNEQIRQDKVGRNHVDASEHRLRL